MTKSIPLGSRGIAILVVNVSVNKIQDYLESYGESQVSYLSVSDRNGGAVFGQAATPSEKYPVQLTSAYSGLTYSSVLKTSLSGNLYEYITSGWVLFGLLGLLIGIWWVVYISRKITSRSNRFFPGFNRITSST